VKKERLHMKNKIAIVGLGYVGLPLAVSFGKKYQTVGYDINQTRVDEIGEGKDATLEISHTELKDVLVPNLIESENQASGLHCTSALGDMSDANIYIITVPTPTDKNKRPILTPLIKASEAVGKVLSQGDYVIYESTVYPGVTEDECVPVLENISGLILNKDFYVGYSPERINPGDKIRTLTNIVKVTSGSTPEAADFIDSLYNSILTNGTHKAPSIKVAEASKVIENSQRDINIAFVNELAKIFNKLNIDTSAVLEAAGTKWNFLPFKPGLVGGHCIGVDPYYLAQKAQESGYYPEIILAGRRINDSMGTFIASDVIKKMISANMHIRDAKVLILGFTFKENCPDVRNTRVIDIVNDFTEYGMSVIVHDPWVDESAVQDEYNLNVISDRGALQTVFDVILLAVSHDLFLEYDIQKLRSSSSLVYDLKGFLPDHLIDARL
jgi:UDP-N-acetyl-D-glucosamine/UDP-N-acetyl-D-galactosamine dehydrogenase